MLRLVAPTMAEMSVRHDQAAQRRRRAVGSRRDAQRWVVVEDPRALPADLPDTEQMRLCSNAAACGQPLVMSLT